MSKIEKNRFEKSFKLHQITLKTSQVENFWSSENFEEKIRLIGATIQNVGDSGASIPYQFFSRYFLTNFNITKKKSLITQFFFQIFYFSIMNIFRIFYPHWNFLVTFHKGIQVRKSQHLFYRRIDLICLNVLRGLTHWFWSKLQFFFLENSLHVWGPVIMS